MTLPDPPNVESHSATTAALNADIETLTAAKGTLEIIPVKVVVESVIVILTLVRVRVPGFSSCLCSLLDNTVRTRLQTTMHMWNWPSAVPERASC
jgi:hypothetical protein